MEAFLSTLPPYVHDFLGKHPPTDVFNILRELVCFAVLYSDDRNHIKSSADSLLQKKKDREAQEEESVVPEAHAIVPIKEETEVEIKENPKDMASVVVAAVTAAAAATKEPHKPAYNVRTGELIKEPSTMPNTFPEWWGHKEFEPQAVSPPPRKETQKQETQDTQPESYGTSWISWDSTPATTSTTTTPENDHHHYSRMERAKSQIIPDLRSYPSEDHARLRSSQTSPNIKRLSTLNSKSATTTSPPARSTPSPAPRVSATPHKVPTRRLSSIVCESPVSTNTPSKFVSSATKQQKLREVNSNSPTPGSGTTTPTRSASVVLKQPRQNAAMRARAEHARQQQEELAKKKSATPLVSSTSLRLKQRVSSGIDWDAIKKERRNTIAEEPKKE